MPSLRGLVLCLAGLCVLSAVGQQPPKRGSAPAAGQQVLTREFTSKALGRVVQYRIILPASYAQEARRYPVLYLLHGLSGSFADWESRTNLGHYAEKYKMIIAMPDAGDSWYVNSATNPNDRYEDFIVEDFIPEIESHWRVLRVPHRRAIAGLSMGGYGAMKFALRHPGMFAVAGSISGAMDAPGELAMERPDFASKLSEVFGNAGSETRTQNDVYALAREARPLETLYFYVDCGNADWALASNREFAKILSERKFQYEYHETPGVHSWRYWDVRLPSLLDAMAIRIAQP